MNLRNFPEKTLINFLLIAPSNVNIVLFRLKETRHILTWLRMKFKSEKLSSENLDLWTYKTKDSFFSYASDIRCVQSAFWAQLVETVEVSFNSINTPLPPGAKLMEGVVWRCVTPPPPLPKKQY